MTACLGSSATFTCEVNVTETVKWVVNGSIMADILNGYKMYQPNNQSPILSIPITNLFQQSVQCYVNAPDFIISLQAFLSVQGMCLLYRFFSYSMHSLPAPLSAPTNITTTALNGTSVLLAWGKVYNAQSISLSYVVLVTNSSGASVFS